MCAGALNMTIHASQHQGATISLAQLLKLRVAARSLDLWQQRDVKGQLGGQHSSRMRGQGIDFSEFRLYQPGDDVRHIDWRVSARRGKTHSKVFQHEKQRAVFIAVDYSASLFFGTRVAFKSVIAAQAAALLAFSSSEQHDRLHGLLFSGQQTIEFPYQPRHRHVTAFLKKLSDTQQALCHQANDYQQVIRLLQKRSRSGSLIILISDFAHLHEEHIGLLRQLNQHNRVIALSITDPFEHALPGAHHYQLSHNEQTLSLNGHDPLLQLDYKNRFQQHQQRLLTIFKQAKVPQLALSTQDDILLALKQFFGQKRC